MRFAHRARPWHSLRLALLLAHSAVAGAAPLDQGASILDTVKRHRTFIQFFAPWCGHCKRLAPTWDALAERDDLGGARVARVDCTTYAAVCKRFGVRAFPTLILAERGGRRLRKHTGGRDIGALARFARSGWREAPLYDSEAQPPPAPKGTFLRRLLASPLPYALLFALLVAAAVCVCVCVCSRGYEPAEDGRTAEDAATPPGGQPRMQQPISGLRRDDPNTNPTDPKKVD